MQVLNLTDGTASPIKSVSEVVVPSECKLSDRDLIALMLTIKDCRDCIRLNRQFDYRSVEMESIIYSHKLLSYKFKDSMYYALIKIKADISTYFKDLEITFDDVKLVENPRKNPFALRVKTLVPANEKIELKGNTIRITGDAWMSPPKDGFIFEMPRFADVWMEPPESGIVAYVASDKPIKLPIRTTLRYKEVKLPIPFPEKYDMKNDNGFWIFTKFHDTARWKGEIIQFGTTDPPASES